MKIAIIYDVIYPHVKGGVEKRVWEFAWRLSRRGHNVHLYGMKFWEGSDIITREGVVLHGVCPAQNLYIHGRRTIREALSFGIALFFRLRTDNYDIIDCQQFPFFSCFSTKLVSTLKKTPFVITWHEVWGDYWYTYLGRIGIIGKTIEWLVTRLTPNTVIVSQTTAENIRKIAGPGNRKIIPNGVNLRDIDRISPQQEISDLIFVGRLIKEKHVDLLLQSMKILTEKKMNLQLLVIGDGPERENLHNLVETLSLENHVRLIGFCENHDEIIAHMKSAKGCVLPSSREGFGIVALEALACGIPVVTLNHPANAVRELITEQNGRLCSFSAEDLAEKIADILVHSSEMKNTCLSSVETFDWDRIVSDLEIYYQSVIDIRR